MSDDEDWVGAAAVGELAPGAAGQVGAHGSERSLPPRLWPPQPLAESDTDGQSCPSSEDDWAEVPSAQAPDQAVASLPLDSMGTAKVDDAPNYRIVRGRILKRPAASSSALTQMAGAPAVAAALALSSTGMPRLARVMFGPRRPGQQDGLLMSHSALAALCEIPVASF